MKAIKRNWMYDHDYTDTLQGEAIFIATGEAYNGKLFYSMLDANGNIDPNHDGSFIQIRHNGHLVMVRI